MAENNTNAPLIETSAVGFTYQGSETPALQDVTPAGCWAAAA